MTHSRTTVVGVQVLPFTNDPYPVVDKAIAAIQASGLRCIVTPMETVMEGPLEDCLRAAQAAHEACFEAGVQKAVTVIKISDAVNGSTIDDKIAKYR